MNKRNSRVGLLGSIALHTTVLGGLWAAVNYVAPTEQPIEEEVTSISAIHKQFQ